MKEAFSSVSSARRRQVRRKRQNEPNLNERNELPRWSSSKSSDERSRWSTPSSLLARVTLLVAISCLVVVTVFFQSSGYSGDDDSGEHRYLYICGIPTKRLHRSLFPDYGDYIAFNPDDPEQARRYTSTDIVLFGIFGNCPRDYDWLQTEFPGRTLFWAPEKYVDYEYRSDRTVQIGLAPDSDRSVRVFYGSIQLIDLYNSTMRNRILDPSKKPMSTQERYLIYVADHKVKHREAAFTALAGIHASTNDPYNNKAHYGGRCKGNNMSIVASAPAAELTDRGDPFDGFVDLYMLYGKYRYCLVMEHSNVKGYITEKIILAFLAGCVPIYYGTREVFEIFSEDAFIYYDIEKPEESIRRVEHLENNADKYNKLVRSPILANGQETVEDFFSLDDGIGNGKLKRKIRYLLDMPLRQRSISS